ncbi:unnamed protein product, partial [marine sediment metagenome]
NNGVLRRAAGIDERTDPFEHCGTDGNAIAARAKIDVYGVRRINQTTGFLRPGASRGGRLLGMTRLESL